MKSRSAILLVLSGLALLAGLSLAGCLPAASSPLPAAPKGLPPQGNPPPSSPANTSLKLTVTQPQDNDTVNASKVEVRGQTSPGAVVSIQDEIAIADNSGGFAITVPLEEGPNLIEVFASDDAGNEVEATLVIIRGG
ncbi:MAG: hypothetical protein Q8O05_03540 [Chloroflexota bacterium]|nr:hypothetical protein [Chloroflexota bacterium]